MLLRGCSLQEAALQQVAAQGFLSLSSRCCRHCFCCCCCCLQEEWLPKLQEVVGQINTSFAANFAQIGCAGEVLLSQHEDYDKFSIQVGPLLFSKRHSSVSRRSC